MMENKIEIVIIFSVVFSVLLLIFAVYMEYKRNIGCVEYKYKTELVFQGYVMMPLQVKTCIKWEN